MNKLTYLFVILFISFTSCENESIDDAFLDFVDQPGGPVNNGLVGDWILLSQNYSGSTTTQAAGQTITSDYVGFSQNENYDVSFNADGTFIATGSYDIVLTSTVQGITVTDTQTISGGSGGNYTATDATLTTTTSLFSYNIDLATGSGFNEPQTTGYVLSPDGQTLTFNYEYNETINQAESSVAISITGTTILVKSNSGGSDNPTTLNGTWLLTAWNTAEAFDLNNDGTATTSVLDEMNCYNNETITFNSDNTCVINNTSYAEITADIVVGTTNEVEFTVDCIQENEILNYTWSQNGNAVLITDDFGDANSWTLDGNTLSLTIPEGFTVFEADGFDVYTTTDLTFVYTKQ